MDEIGSSTGKHHSLKTRRLGVPGTEVHLEPVPSADRQGRPIREPRPEEGMPDGGVPHEGSFHERPSHEGAPDKALDGGGSSLWPENNRLLAGEVPSGTGLAHRWLRQKNLFAELRALRNGEEGEVGRDEYLHVRLSPLTATLLGETVATSRYRSLSAYVRAVATGRDRAGPILAKAGALFFWARAHLGGKVSAREWGNLRDLLRPLLGPEERSSPKERSPVEECSPAEELLRTEELREGLKLARRHLQAGQLRAEGKPFGEGDLPGAPEATRQKTAGFPETPVSIRLLEARKQLIRENASYSSYDGMSSYVRHMALGWDRNGQVLAQGAAIARWVERHLGEEITSKQWERLGKAFRRRFGVFLIGAGPDGELDVEGALRRGAEHLLGARLETIAEETQLSL